MGTGITPVTREEQFAGALSGDMAVEDLPKAETRIEKYLKYAAEHGGGGGGGFTPTEEQLAAMNSGITAEKLTEDEANISSLQGHFTFSANSKMYYLQPEQPSNPSDGDIWIG